jgi:hypothetical protein
MGGSDKVYILLLRGHGVDKFISRFSWGFGLSGGGRNGRKGWDGTYDMKVGCMDGEEQSQ